MTETTHLMLPYLAAAQAQKHVTHNEALRLLDAMVQLAVLDRDLTAPPSSPADGARYIVASGATGGWEGWDLSVAYYVDGAWTRLVPRGGWLAWVADEDVLLLYGGSGWSGVGGGDGVTLAALSDGTVTILGVNTAGDSTNRLAVRSNSVLFTAINAGDGGNGDMRYVVNKETASDTVSFLFQTSWSGRAEIGTMGSDLFGVKVSPDGSAWTQAFVVDADGRWLSGVLAAAPVFPADLMPYLQMHGNSIATTAMLGARWSNDAAAPQYILGKSRSTTFGVAGAPVQSGDTLGSFVIAADDGTRIVQAAEFRAVAAANWSAASGRSGRIQFRTRHEDSLAVRLVLESGGALKPLSIGTTASAANAFLNSADDNSLLRSTSSERYKRDVEPVEEVRSDAILELEPIWYRSTAPADRPDWSWYGLIAEEVAAVEPRLVHFGYHDDDYELVEEPEEGGEPSHRRVLKRGAELKPDGVQYDRLAVLLLDIVKRQDARITALEARVLKEDRSEFGT